MADTADYYKVLGVDSKATPAEIKSAYHAKAKRTHPDAGGSQAEMERLNHAYQVLSSPLARRDYDAERHQPSPHHQPASPTPGHHTAHPQHHAHTDFHRQRRAQARAVALQMLTRSLVAALILIFLMHFLLSINAAGSIRWLLLLIEFIPLYLTALAVVFLIDPDLRLQLFDLRHLGGWRPKIGLFRLLCLLGLPFIPLAVLWVWLGST